MPNPLADLIPAKYRRWVYAALTVVMAVQTAAHVIPDGIWAKVATGITALIAALATANTTTPEV